MYSWLWNNSRLQYRAAKRHSFMINPPNEHSGCTHEGATRQLFIFLFYFEINTTCKLYIKNKHHFYFIKFYNKQASTAHEFHSRLQSTTSTATRASTAEVAPTPAQPWRHDTPSSPTIQTNGPFKRPHKAFLISKAFYISSLITQLIESTNPLIICKRLIERIFFNLVWWN